MSDSEVVDLTQKIENRDIWNAIGNLTDTVKVLNDVIVKNMESDKKVLNTLSEYIKVTTCSLQDLQKRVRSLEERR